MVTRTIYSMIDIESHKQNGKVFIMAFDGEDRSYYGWNKLASNDSRFESLLVLSYDRNLFEEKKSLIILKGDVDLTVIDIPIEQSDFVDALIGIEELSHYNELTIDISCMKTPNLFLMMKYFKSLSDDEVLESTWKYT